MGSGGGSGGGSSGVVDFPAYMKTFQSRLLDNEGDDYPSKSFIDIYNSALVNNPFLSAHGYNPYSEINAMNVALADFEGVLGGYTEGTWNGYITTSFIGAKDTIDGLLTWPSFVAASQIQANLGNDDAIQADVDAFADQLDSQIESTVLPRFQAGMRNINAVNSSAFIIGQALIENGRDIEVAKHASGLRVSLAQQRDGILGQAYINEDKILTERTRQYVAFIMEGANSIAQIMNAGDALSDSFYRLAIDTKRLQIIANTEYIDQEVSYDEAEAKWQLELLSHGSNLLAGISGGVKDDKDKKPSKLTSALAGGVGGAAAGAMIGAKVGSGYPGIGTAIGAVVGAAAGWLSS
jgi:hypothetical protein